jgi:hypothetical protein
LEDRRPPEFPGENFRALKEREFSCYGEKLLDEEMNRRSTAPGT